MSETSEAEAFVKTVAEATRQSARVVADTAFLEMTNLPEGCPSEVFEQFTDTGLSSVAEGVRATLAKYSLRPDVLDVFVQVGQEAFTDRIALLCDGGPGGNA